MLAVGVLAACTWFDQPAADTPAPQRPTPSENRGDRSLRWAIEEPTTLVPHDAVAPSDVVVVDALYDSLTTWDDDLAVAPAAARSWTTPDAGRTWVFRIRDELTFHDGTPVTAATFVTGWNRTAKGAAHHHLRDVAGYDRVRSGSATALAGLEAVSRTTLRVRLRHPFMDFPAVAGHPSLAPSRAGPDSEQDRPVGNGPFRLAEPWARGRFVRLTRAAGRVDVDRPPTAASEGRAFAVDEVLFTFPDPEGAAIALEQGRLDVVVVAPVARGTIQAVEARQPAITLVEVGAAATTMLLVDTRRAPFDQASVRRGLSLALRRDALAVPGLAGTAGPATTLVPPSLAGGGYTRCHACRHDPERARTLLRRARLRNLRVHVPLGIGLERFGSKVRDQLGAVGIRAAVRPVAFSSYERRLRRGGVAVFRLPWVLDYPTLDNALFPLLHSSEAVSGSNFAHYTSPAVDRLLRRARSTVDRTARLQLYRRAEGRATRDMAVIPVLTHRHHLALAGRVRGFEWTAMGTVDLTAVRLAAMPDGA